MSSNTRHEVVHGLHAACRAATLGASATRTIFLFLAHWQYCRLFVIYSYRFLLQADAYRLTVLLASNSSRYYMRITFNLIEKAIDLATRVFVTVRDVNNSASSNESHLVSMIDEVSKKIDSVATHIGAEVAHQLEKQQLEKLSSQAKVVKLALEIDNAAMLGTAVASISEQIEYSRLRLSEGKHEWFGPWMIAEAVRIEALRIMAANPRALAAVERETLNFRINILNHVGVFLITSMDNPWVQIADFVDGRNEDVLLSLRDVKVLQVADDTAVKSKRQAASHGASTLESESTSSEASTVIAPAAWPFPTSLRP